MAFAAAAPLRRRDFLLFWLGKVISQFGDNISLIAQVWLVFNLTGSPSAMATVVLCGQIPSVAMILVGGTLVDRFPRRMVAMLSDLVRGALLLALAALYFAGTLAPVHMYLMAGAFGFVKAFASPAFGAILPSLVPPGERVASNSLIQAGSMVAGIAGPVLGGLIMATGGAGLALTIDAASFFIAALGLWMAHPDEPQRVQQATPLKVRVLVSDMKEALRLLSGKGFLLFTIGFMALINVTGQAPVIILRPWIAQRLSGGDPGVLSMAYACFTAGMGLTITVLGTLQVQRYRGRMIYAGILIAGICQVGIAFVTAPWQFWVLEFILGAAVMTHGVIWAGLLQDSVSPEAMGRISAIDSFGSLILYPMGIALVGYLAKGPGPFWIMLVGGVMTALVSVVALLTMWGRDEA